MEIGALLVHLDALDLNISLKFAKNTSVAMLSFDNRRDEEIRCLNASKLTRNKCCRNLYF